MGTRAGRHRVGQRLLANAFAIKLLLCTHPQLVEIQLTDGGDDVDVIRLGGVNFIRVIQRAEDDVILVGHAGHLNADVVGLVPDLKDVDSVEFGLEQADPLDLGVDAFKVFIAFGAFALGPQDHHQRTAQTTEQKAQCEAVHAAQ